MMRGRPVLLLDADAGLRRVLAKQVGADGLFAVATAGSAGEAEAMASAPGARFDALILGVALPDGDGCALCARLRRQGLVGPVLLLAESPDEAELVRGFAAGADDYLVKPVRLRELLARLRAQLRGYEGGQDAAFAIGPYVFRPAAKLLHDPARDRRVRLTDKEAGLLRALYRAGGAPMSRRALLDEVWGYKAAMAERTLETHLYRLRRKIEPDPDNPRLLVTVGGGRGYRLDAAPLSAAA